MQVKSYLLVTADLEKSKSFYQEVMGLNIDLDLGAHVILSGGLCLQTLASWQDFIGVDGAEIAFGGKDGEIYFEEDDLDNFLTKLQGISGIQYVHPLMEHRWGQRVIRFYDPDSHIIEVGESLEVVCSRFLADGMTAEEVAARMDMPAGWVEQHRL